MSVNLGLGGRMYYGGEWVCGWSGQQIRGRLWGAQDIVVEILL